MKVRTLDELYSKLDDEIRWRKKEMLDYKFVVNKYTKSTQIIPLIRGGIALGYAHWEGFVKNSSSIYINYISTKKIPFKNINDNFITLSFLKRLNKGKNIDQCLILIDDLLNNLSKPCKINDKDVIDTKANLGYYVLEDILKLLGLDCAHFKKLEFFLNKKLVAPRNDIAHGVYREVQIDDYNIVHKQVIPLMEHFKTLIENVCLTNGYKK